MADITTLLQEIKKTIDAVDAHKQIASVLSEDTQIFDEVIGFCNITYQAIKAKQTLPDNYINTITQNINNVYSVLSYRKHDTASIVHNLSQPDGLDSKKEVIKTFTSGLKKNFKSLKFILNIFMELDFFENNIVLIGSNGSGKTTLANRLRSGFNPNNGIVISAQRSLRVSKYDAIDSVTKTKSQLKSSWGKDKTYKHVNHYGDMQNEFDIVFKNLVADNIAVGLQYSHSSKVTAPESIAPKTSLDNTIEIWNSLIGHRKLAFADDHINIVPKTQDGTAYELVQMSDGEKVMLYLIAQVLQAPENGFIIVDEPEIYLHRSILRKLWDKLETKRDDCIFVYLTHDIEFAVSRDVAQKVWIRSYMPPDSWEFEAVENTELPEELFLELLGSQKKILFCEGEIGGDEKMYNILFPNFTIKPVGGCKNVINYVRAYNQIPNRLSKAFGVVDADFRDQGELDSLEEDGIFILRIAEIENLLLDEDLLTICAERLHCNNGEIANIKHAVIKKFSEDIEMQASHFVTSKVNHIFNNSHISRKNEISEVVTEFKMFTDQIDIEKWHADRRELLAKIVDSQDHTETIKLYNNKGLIAIANQVFKKRDFGDFAIKELKNNIDGQENLKKHFPAGLITEHDS